MLLKGGANVNAQTRAFYEDRKDPIVKTPLMWFAKFCDLEAIKVLLENKILD